jgi:DNA-binding response OmpR family regulator
MSAKILFAKKRAGETRAHAIVVGEAGFYWRELPGDAELAGALRAERFSLIIVDHADLAEDPLAYVERLRAGQQDTPVLMVSEQLALDNVVRAIRVGVKDLFHPPIDLTAIVERIHSVLKPELGSTRGARLDDWRELTVQFADRATIPPLVAVERRSGPPRRAADVALASETAAELKALREALAQARARAQVLEQEISAQQEQRVTAANAPAGAPERGPAVEPEVLAAQQALVLQLSRKFEAELAAGKAAEGAARAELARREQELIRKTNELAATQEAATVELILLNEAKAKLAEDRSGAADAQAAQRETAAKLRQLVIEQSALTKTREKLEREEVVWQGARAKTEADHAATAEKLSAELRDLGERTGQVAADRRVLEAWQGKLQRQGQGLADKEAEFRAREEQTHLLAAETQQALAQLKAEQVALGKEKAACERDSLALADRAQLFETRQQQVRVQMQQLLAVG